MKKKVSILLHSMLLVFIMAIWIGSSSVRAEDAVTINHTKYTVNIGDEDDVLQLKMENQPEGAKKPRWISYNVNVASVDQDGVVTPLRKGKAIISSGIGFPRKTCVVTVVDPSVKLNKTAATLYRSAQENTPGNTVTLTAKVNGATKKATDVVWSSSNTEVAKVAADNKGRGVVTSTNQAGEAVITARVNGRTATCKVTVRESAISLNVAAIQLSTKGAGSSIKLTPTVVGAKKSVTWTSSDRKTATVSGGKVTGKKAGVVTITAKANGVETTCSVTVTEGLISISEEKVQLYATKDADGKVQGETKQLKTNAARTDTVVWSSSDETIAKVEGLSGGKANVTATGAGEAVITAACGGKTDTCVVEVTNTSTTIAEKIVHLRTKGAAKTYTLDYRVVGRKSAITWKSSDTKVVSVSKGKITGKKAGVATITMTANGVKDEVQVTVQEYTPTIALNQKEYTLYTKGKGNTLALKATINGASKKTEWKSSAPAIAEVSTKGKVTAKGEGRALITATANGVTAKCWVSVKAPKIILEKNALVLKPQEKVDLREYTSIEVTGATQTVTYKSSDTKTATVTGKGLVTAKKAGKAEITIKANGVEEKCYITVSACEAHSFGAAEVVKAASCDESGLISYTCSVCEGKRQEVTEPLGHTYGKWSVYAWSTENAAGLERQVCARCKAENTRIIPAKNKGEQAYGYQLVWEDDFNGTALDRDSWNVELHDPGWVNAEWQSYVDSTENIYVKDGNLVIQAIKNGDNYTSGRVNTQNKHDYQYGRFEARAKVPSGKGFLPAFWMMPTDESYYGQWPKCGEIDIMEVLGDKTNMAHSTLHFGEPHTQKQGTYTLADGEADFAEDFHIYACEWDPDEFRFYVDNQLFYTVNDWFTKREGFGESAYPAPYDQPFYMILNLAVGGSWVGYPDETTAFGENAQLVVDYVRVYQKDEYDTDVSKTETDVKLKDPDTTGNYIVNGDFTAVEDLSKTEAEQVNWKLHLEAEDAATAEIKEEALHIHAKQIGTVNYHVQIVQADLPIEKGSSYRLTYDAWADEARTMVTAVKAPDRGYICYLDETTVGLTTEPQTFTHEFSMTSDSDANGRVEFNLGAQGSVATVHIDNVRLEKIGSVEEEEEIRSVLPDGNYVYNGSFNEGNEPGRLRLAYWDWNVGRCKGAGVSVTGDAKRELKVVVPQTVAALDDVVVSQEPIAIKGGKTYVLSFDAYADQAKTIKAAIAGETFESALTTEKQEYRYEFDVAAELDGSVLRFLLGTAGVTYIDNVSIREDGLIVNGDFSSGMVGYEVYVNEAAKVSGYIVDSLNDAKNPAFAIDIEDTGTQDWYIQLKQNNIKLEGDKWYKIAFDAKSTQDRQIMYALQRDGSSHKDQNGNEDWTPYSGTQRISLTGEYQNFSHTFEMTEGTDPETILSISMGAVGGTQVSTKHTVMIDNITLEETEPVEVPPVEEGDNLIKNGDFAQGDANWENAVTAPGAAQVSFADGKAVYNITNVGSEDWHIQLKQSGLKLEKGAEYEIRMKLTSTEARTVKYAFLNQSYDWYGGEDVSLNAGVTKEVNYKLAVSKDTDAAIDFVISMGQIKNGDELVNTPVSMIEIDDVSVVKLSGTGDDPSDDPSDDPAVEIGTELIKNGNFAEGKTDWSDYVHESAGAAAVSAFADHKARYEITNAGTDDWNVQLKQEGLAMEKDAAYKVNFKIGASIDRDVRLAFMGAQDAWCGGADISLSKDKLKSYSQIVTLNDNYVSGTIAFQISIGQLGDTPLAAHAVEISDVSVTKVAAGTEADEVTETDVTIAPPAGSGSGSDEGEGDEPDPDEPAATAGTELIQNGDFAEGDANWVNAVTAPGAAEVSFADGKAVYKITNVGSEDWHIQLKQSGLKLEKGAEYEIRMKLTSTEARTVKYAFLNQSYDWYGGEDLSLSENETKEVNYKLKVDKDTDEAIDFVISMGKIADMDTPVSTIEIDDISVKKTAAGSATGQDTEDEGTTEKPAEGGDGSDEEEGDAPSSDHSASGTGTEETTEPSAKDDDDLEGEPSTEPVIDNSGDHSGDVAGEQPDRDREEETADFDEDAEALTDTYPVNDHHEVR